MNSTVIQHWQFGYACVAFLVAVAAPLVADRLRAGEPPALTIRCAAAGLVGALWPFALLGAAQIWVIAVLADRLSPPQTTVEPAPQLLAAVGSH